MSGYVGVEPIPQANTIITQGTIAGSTSSIFVPNGYNIGNIEVFLNGLRLKSTDFTATDGVYVNFNQTLTIGTDYLIQDVRNYQQADVDSKITVLNTQSRAMAVRLAAEAGYNLVDGSFEEGGSLVNPEDVLWYRGDGKYYSWFNKTAKSIAAGSTPATSGGVGAGAWVNRTDDSLRYEIRETVFQNMKHQAAEAGFNLVDGSFEEGADISGWPDVVWCQALGIYFQWKTDEAKTVAAGSTPTNIGTDWIDKSGELFIKNTGDFRYYGGRVQTGFDNAPAINAALADVGFCVIPVGGTVEIYQALSDGAKIRGALNTETVLQMSADIGTDYYITNPLELSNLVISGNNTAKNGIDWSHTNAPSSFLGWTHGKDVIVKSFTNTAVNVGNVFALWWENFRILQNGTATSDPACVISPTDATSGYFTTIYWKNVYLNQNNNQALSVAPTLKSPNFIWDGVVIEENCLLGGTRQAYITRVDPFEISGLYLENGTVPALVLDNIRGSARGLYLNNNTNDAITFVATTADFNFEDVKITGVGANTITLNGGALQRVGFKNSAVSFNGGTIPSINRLKLENTRANGTYYADYTVGTAARLQVNDASKIRAVRTYQLTGLNKTITAGSRVSLGQVNLGSILVDTAGVATLKSFQPDIILTVTPATTGSTDYFNVFARNMSASDIILSSDVCTVVFIRCDFS